MPASTIDGLFADALDAIGAALADDGDPQLQWNTAASLINAAGRTPPPAVADLYDTAVAVLAARFVSVDPDAARSAAAFVVEFEARNPAP